VLIRSQAPACTSPMLPGAEFEADVVLVAPREFELTRATRTYREKNFTTFTELLSVSAFQTEYIKRINEALGLEALASYLEPAGIRTAIINCNVAPHTVNEVVEKVRRSKARVVGISLIYRPQVSFAIELTQALAAVKDVQVCMGGALASFMPRELLATLDRLDAVIYGEAEETFREYCKAVLGSNSRARRDTGPFRVLTSGENDRRALPGVAYRGAGLPVVNSAGPALDLLAVKTPARQTLAYLQATGWPTRIASIYTSRGCMAKCTFCTGKDAYNVERMRTYRYRDPVSVADEIEHLHEAFGVRFVYINDDNFLGYGAKSYDRVRVFANEMIARKLGVQFATECRVDGLEDDLLRLLREAGMTQVLLGIESGSDAVLTRWRKGATVAQNRAALETIRRAGVALEPGFILFDAHTSREELLENTAFIRGTRLHHIPNPTYLVNRLSVYPGTEIEQLLVADGTIAPSPIQYGRGAANGVRALIEFFQRYEYRCRDTRAEIAWRGLRYGLEPIEMFLEDQLPALTASLAGSRRVASKRERDQVRELISRAAAWRRRVGDLVLDLIEKTAASYDVIGHAAQLRWLRRELPRMQEEYARATLGENLDQFSERVLDLRRRLNPVAVSVVIPSAGKWSRLRRTLAALAGQQLSASLRWEIVVVLDGVVAPEEFRFEVGRTPVRVLRLDDAKGRGGARNAGIKEARGEIIVLLDDDVVVAPRFLEAHLEQQRRRACLCHGPLREIPMLAYLDDLDALTIHPSLEAAPSHQRVTAWAARVLEKIQDVDECWDRFGAASRLEEDGARAAAAGRPAAAWLAFAGANLSAPRSWLLEDGFDERPGQRWGLEDIALALRWSLAGRPLSIAADARGLHLSHLRSHWKVQQRENAACFDFLPEDAVETVLRYLENRGDALDVERALDSHFRRARRRPA
jgi:radical SAM superfamily enzyme YgiQ (UPF0313 family)/GT2 family glycosyltransferase